MELIYKTPDQNTIGERRVQMISEGKSLTATPTAPGVRGVPRMESVGVSDVNMMGRLGVIDDPAVFGNINKPWLQSQIRIGAIMAGLDAPLPKLGNRSIRELIASGGLKMEGNSLPSGWANLWDAMRLDITIRKLSRPTVRELIYNMIDVPNATRTMNLTELYSHNIVFKENNGAGQSVNQGELMAGQYDTATQKIYAAGLIIDLMSVLFNNAYTDQSVNDAVAIAENGIKDDNALAPIFGYSYATAAQTAADTTSGATKYELLYRTIETAVDALGQRTDPITNREIDATGLVLIASPTNAKRIARVISGAGFPANSNSGFYPAIDSISKVIGYEPETIVGTNETTSYTAVTTGKCYIVKPNRRMLVAVKRGLQLNVNQNPNPETLAQAVKSWWFCEALYNAGIADFIQEVTLPSWA